MKRRDVVQRLGELLRRPLAADEADGHDGALWDGATVLEVVCGGFGGNKIGYSIYLEHSQVAELLSLHFITAMGAALHSFDTFE